MSEQPSPNNTAPAAPRRWPIIVLLIIFAAFEVWVGWNSPIPDEPATLRGVLTIIHIAGQFLFGAGAFLCALFGRVRAAIVLLAANMVVGWFGSSMFDPANWTFTTAYSTFESVMNLVVMPVAALAAAAFAMKNQRLGWATFLICLPTLYVLAMMAAFAISVSIKGF